MPPKADLAWRGPAALGLATGGLTALVWFGGTPDRALYLAFLLLAGAAAAVCAGRSGTRLAIGPAVLVAVGVILCILVAIEPTLTARGYTVAAVWWLSLFLSLALTEGRPRARRWLLAAVIASGAAEAAYGLLQALGGVDRIGSYERGLGSLATGTFINRNHFAAFVNLALLAAIGALLAGLGATGRKARVETAARTWLAILACGALGWGVILSRSRGGVLALAAALAVISVAMMARGRYGRAIPLVVTSLFAGAVLVAGAAIGLPSLIERGLDPGDRVALFGDTLRLIADRPLGVGPGMYEMGFRAYQTVALERRFHHAHSDYLEILAEWGLPVGLALIGLLLWTLSRSLRRFAGTVDPVEAGLLLGVSGAMCSLLVHGLFENNLQIPATAIAFWSLVGVAWTATVRPRSRPRRTLPTAPLRWLLLLTLLLAGWQVFPRWRALQVEKSTSGIEGHLEALEWDPKNPELHADLARRYRESEPPDLAAAVQAWEHAVRLNPRSWRYRMEQSRALELAGQADEAEAAMLLAVELNPRAPRYRWRLAELYLRRGDLETARPHLVAVVAADPTRRDRVLERLFDAGASAEVIATIWPPGREARLDLMRRILTNWDPEPPRRLRRLVAAEWGRLIAAPETLAVEDGLILVAHLVRAERPVRARRRWIQLQRAAGSHDPAYARGTTFVWNGGFERTPVKSPFDWSLTVPAGVTATLAAGEGVGETTGLRLDFSGEHNLHLSGVSQRLAVGDDEVTELELAYSVRAEDLTTDRGVFFEIVDTWSGQTLLRTEAVTGSVPWTRHRATFALPAESVSLLLRLRRLPSANFDSKISGRMWLDEVVLSLRESTP